MALEKINVRLYGGKSIFGGRETPLEADEIYCDHAEECSFYKNGTCLNCRKPFTGKCKFGKVKTVKGYTSRAAKYYQFRRKYESDPVYRKLSYPNEMVGLIGDALYLNPVYVSVVKDNAQEQCGVVVDGYRVRDPGFGSKEVYIPLSELTIKLLGFILMFRPFQMFGHGEITDYQAKIVPDLLFELRRVVPDIHSMLIKGYPELDIAPNYIGKSVYIYSLKPETVHKDSRGNEWIFDGEYVSSVGEIDLGSGSPWWLSGGSRGSAKIRVSRDMTINVTDNAMVDENTVFEK